MIEMELTLAPMMSCREVNIMGTVQELIMSTTYISLLETVDIRNKTNTAALTETTRLHKSPRYNAPTDNLQVSQLPLGRPSAGPKMLSLRFLAHFNRTTAMASNAIQISYTQSYAQATRNDAMMVNWKYPQLWSALDEVSHQFRINHLWARRFVKSERCSNEKNGRRLARSFNGPTSTYVSESSTKM